MQPLLLSIALALSLLISAGATDGYRMQHETESAMAEMTNLFHSLFPLVPEHTHFFWKSNQLGAATVHRTSPPAMSAPDGGGRTSGCSAPSPMSFSVLIEDAIFREADSVDAGSLPGRLSFS
ncbi:hypothetical protein NPIL_140051 [Nephila pilipes]|uniref:Uncharacterized protein n=1 Tax=Nephila pilipes TaxID=299642 RepID=A0A8X6QLK8_NEPPI|nr:hypothetical protein NPIL_140051 [Nephila pilipes]